RRALLLPQEVKELGTEEAIIFYEGLRPIRCRKIRYYADRRFRERLFAPPATPAPYPGPATSPATLPIAATAGPNAAPDSVPHGDAAEPAAPRGAPILRTREATVEDIERIDSLTLEDFATDFSHLKIPDHEGPITDAEMNAAVERFLN